MSEDQTYPAPTITLHEELETKPSPDNAEVRLFMKLMRQFD